MDQKQLYQDGTYLHNNPTWHQEDSEWKAERIEKILSKNGIKPASICEVGCGAGEILNRLSEKKGENIQYYGYEISPQAFNICKQKERSNLHFYMDDLLEKDNTNFDVALAIDVFEHVEDYLGFLRKLQGKAKYKVFHIPLDLSVQSIFRTSPILYARSNVGHLHYFFKETALATLKDAGYEIIDYFYTCGSIELPNRGWKATLMKLPRKLLFITNQDFAARLFGGFSLMVLTK